jgi:hypoxanthine phosphoribosyltransferase
MYGILMVLNLNFNSEIAICKLFKNRIVMIQLHDKQFVPFISAKEIEFAITKWCSVEDDFIDETPVFIGVLNGSFMVVSL